MTKGGKKQQQQQGGGAVPPQAQRLLTRALGALAAAGGLWLALRFLLPWLAPLLLALALAALLEPAVRFLNRRGWRRGLAAGLLTLLLLGALVWALVRLGGLAMEALPALAKQAPALMRALAEAAERWEEKLLSASAAAPPALTGYLDAALDGLGEALTALPLRLSRWALDLAARAAQSGPDVLLFAVTAGLGTYFFSAGFPRCTAFLSAQLPEELRRRLAGLGRDLKSGFGGLLRAQLLLMGMTFCELLPAFLLMGVSGAPGLAALTALVDALPVFGTGTVLLPWALAALLLGRGGRALGLALCWAAVNLIRSAAQAKLLGDQIGLHPLASLAAVYVGWRVCGVWGMLLFPVLLSVLQQLNDRGVVRLWKTSE